MIKGLVHSGSGQAEGRVDEEHHGAGILVHLQGRVIRLGEVFGHFFENYSRSPNFPAIFYRIK
jgi:hypothetical protein